MGIFSGLKAKEELMLVFNVGSSSVGGALFVAQKSGIPKIIFSVCEPIALEKKVDIDRFLFLTAQSLEIAANKIYKAGLGAPSKIFCVLSSPWYISQTRTINLKKNTSFVFTSKLADDLIKKEVNSFEEEHLIKKINAGEGVRTIELKNIKTMLNGYETSMPLNQKAKELEITIFVSVSRGKVLKSIEDTIGKFFHFKRIQFSSFAMASFTIVRDLYAHQENFLLIDIGGEVTDICMVKKSMLRESISFPLGRNFFTRGVAAGFNCTLDEASSLISLFKDGHAEESTNKKLAPVINQLRKDWLKQFQESLANLSNDISIPAAIYMATYKDLADFFSETIKNEQFNQYTLTESKFEVTFLSAELLHDIAVFENETIRESFLIIDSIYINRFLTNPGASGRT